MSFLHTISSKARHFGIDVKRYNPVNSEGARVCSLLTQQRIDLVLDVGANDGGFGRFLREHGHNGRMISFEPLGDAYERLHKNISGDCNWKMAQRMALGQYDGEVEINVAGNSTSSSVLPMLQAHVDSAPSSLFVGKEKVRLARLDTLTEPWIDEAQRIYLKIDTQGYEKSVLDGATSILHKVYGIQLEMSLVPLYEGQALFRELFDYIEKLGFEPFDMLPCFRDHKTGRLMQLDGVFIKSE
jgi:FkbM family methyltransferase